MYFYEVTASGDGAMTRKKIAPQNFEPYELTAGELLTFSEWRKLSDSKLWNYMTRGKIIRRDINRKNTFYFFGKRFEIK